MSPLNVFCYFPSRKRKQKCYLLKILPALIRLSQYCNLNHLNYGKRYKFCALEVQRRQDDSCISQSSYGNFKWEGGTKRVPLSPQNWLQMLHGKSFLQPCWVVMGKGDDFKEFCCRSICATLQAGYGEGGGWSDFSREAFVLMVQESCTYMRTCWLTWAVYIIVICYTRPTTSARILHTLTSSRQNLKGPDDGHRNAGFKTLVNRSVF
jgi:hypothetical protein